LPFVRHSSTDFTAAFRTSLEAVLGSPSLASQVMVATFSPMDLLFYAIAGYEGFRLVMR
jgi:hypothetical protein